MLDSTTICLIRKYKGDLGKQVIFLNNLKNIFCYNFNDILKQRLMGVLASAIFGLCSGLILEWAAKLNNGN